VLSTSFGPCMRRWQPEVGARRPACAPLLAASTRGSPDQYVRRHMDSCRVSRELAVCRTTTGSHRFAWGRRRIVDHPFSAFTGFRDSRPLGTKDDGSVARSPCLASILAIDSIEWAPHFIRREIYLPSCGIHCEPLVFVIHASILACQRVPSRRLSPSGIALVNSQPIRHALG
jgi:hypothetical protein